MRTVAASTTTSHGPTSNALPTPSRPDSTEIPSSEFFSKIQTSRSPFHHFTSFEKQRKTGREMFNSSHSSHFLLLKTSALYCTFRCFLCDFVVPTAWIFYIFFLWNSSLICHHFLPFSSSSFYWILFVFDVSHPRSVSHPWIFYD